MQITRFRSLRLRKIVQITQDQQQIFEYIEDADLWRWKLPDSKAFHAGLPLMHGARVCFCTLKDTVSKLAVTSVTLALCKLLSLQGWAV